MGCTQAVQHSDDEDSKIVRLDIHTIRTNSTPKNEISLMKLTEQLLKVFEVICGGDENAKEKNQFEQF
jgi:hypothetical protein